MNPLSQETAASTPPIPITPARVDPIAKLRRALDCLRHPKSSESINPLEEFRQKRQEQHFADADDIAEGLIVLTMPSSLTAKYKQVDELSAEMKEKEAADQPVPDDLRKKVVDASNAVLDEAGKFDPDQTPRKHVYNKIVLFLAGLPQGNPQLMNTAYESDQQISRQALVELVQMGKQYNYLMESGTTSGQLKLYEIYQQLGIDGLKLGVRACLGDWNQNIPSGQISGYENLIKHLDVFKNGGAAESPKP